MGWFLPADLVLGQRLVWPELSPPWPLAALAAWVGAIAGTYSFNREVFPWMTTRMWLHQTLAGWGMRFFWWFIFFGIIALMPETLDWQAGVLVCVYLGAIALWTRGGMVWSFKKLRLLSSAPDRLRSIVAEVSARMNLPVRRTWLLHSGSGAYALVYTGELLFSERLLKLLPDEEVGAICAHELGHLGESKWTRTNRFLGWMAWAIPWLFFRPAVHAWGPGGVLAIGSASWIAVIMNRRHSRSLETRADGIAQSNELEAGTYARALERLHRESLLPAVLPRRNLTHPDLYDRLLAVGVQPDYPRPTKPESSAWHGYLLFVLFVILAVANMARFFAQAG